MPMLSLIVPTIEHLVERLVSDDVTQEEINKLKEDVFTVAKIILVNIEHEIEREILNFIENTIAAKLKEMFN